MLFYYIFYILSHLFKLVSDVQILDDRSGPAAPGDSVDQSGMSNNNGTSDGKPADEEQLDQGCIGFNLWGACIGGSWK